MSAIAGRVLLIPKGNYDSTATYTMLDMVVYNGSSYICKQECTGVVPTNTTYWMLNASGSAVAFLNDIGDVVITNVSNGQVLMYDSTTQKWVNGTLTLNGLNDTQFASLSDGQVLKYNATSQKWENADEKGGILPHLIVISETGSTVTATKGQTVITATETSTGYFECDLTELGTWTIDAILGGDDAQVSLVVDTVKVYTVDDSHFHATVTVTYPIGATCGISGQGETYYATTDPYTFTVHHTGTYTLTCTLNNKSATKTVTITSDGQTESVNFTTEDIFDGSTITPINDIQIWLNCADIFNKSHTTLNEVLADSSTLQSLILSQNACDYLVRSTSWVNGICANQTAMSYIGLNNYCANTLLADSDWRDGICNSTYFESVLNVKVPIMTSNTTPYGKVVYSGASTGYDDRAPYKAFNGVVSDMDRWMNSPASTSGQYLGYKFTSPICVNKILLNCISSQTFGTFDIEASNDGTNWTKLGEGSYSSSDTGEKIFTFSNTNYYSYYRIIENTNTVAIRSISTLQFYGREDV